MAGLPVCPGPGAILSKPSLVDEIVAHADARRRRGPLCFTCRLPPDILRAIHRARDRNVEQASIYYWLKEQKPPLPYVSESSIEHHFLRGHQPPK